MIFQIRNIYYPRYNSYTMEKILSFLGVLLLILAGTFRFIFKFMDLSDIFLALCLSAWFVPAVLNVFKWWEGYRVEEDGISFKHMAKRNKLLYENVHCILLSNAQFNSRITKTPWIAFIGGEADKILEYCMCKRFRNHVLTSREIQYTLGGAIGCYHPGNVQEALKRGSSAICNYGFVWNKREAYKILSGFKGDYYIAASVFHHFNHDIKDICRKYNISSDRIHIIEDSSNEGEYIWH